MKIQDLLVENFAPQHDLYSKLSNQHIAALKMAYDGRLPDFEDATDTAKRLMGQLASYGLLTDTDFTPTEEGMRILQIASTDAARKPRRAQSSSWSHNGGREDLVADVSELGDQVAPLNGRVTSINGRVNRDGSI